MENSEDFQFIKMPNELPVSGFAKVSRPITNFCITSYNIKGMGAFADRLLGTSTSKD